VRKSNSLGENWESEKNENDNSFPANKVSYFYHSFVCEAQKNYQGKVERLKTSNIFLNSIYAKAQHFEIIRTEIFYFKNIPFILVISFYFLFYFLG